MNEDQEQKYHSSRFCKQSFSNGKKLEGHMRTHLGSISTCRKKGTQKCNQAAINGEKGLDVHNDDHRIINESEGINQDYNAGYKKQSIQENDQGIINGEKGLNADDVMIKKHHQDHIYGDNVHTLKENPESSWRVSSSISDSRRITLKRCESSKKSMKNTVCKQCGKVFDSMKALYGHMRCHSIKRSRPSDQSSSLSSLEEIDEDAEVENGALCLMMLSRGVRSLDGIKLFNSNQAKFVVPKKKLIVESGSGQRNTGQSRSTMVKYKSTKKRKSCHQDLETEIRC